MKQSVWKRLMSVCTAAVLGVGLMVPAVSAGAQEDGSRLWDFRDGEQGWVYDDSWKGSAEVTGNVSHDAEKEMLKVDIDFTAEKDNGWCQSGISFSEESGIDYSEFNTLTFDLYYDAAAYTTGQITVKAVADNVFQEQMEGISSAVTEDMGDGLKKASFTFHCDETYASAERPQKLMLLIVGNSTDYKGSLWFDDICLSYIEEEDIYVDASVAPDSAVSLSGNADTLTVNGEPVDYADSVRLADPDADEETAAVYQYLKAGGESGSTIYGHMEDTVLKAGTSSLSWSDTQDMTGSISGIVGLDCGNLFDGFAAKYNSRYGGSLSETTEGNITAAAYFSNLAIEDGAIMTLSAHMPNFAFSEEKENTTGKTYDQYDYLAADSYNLSGDCMNQILPGGAYHERFNAYLDMVAEYAHQVDGTILFRPFHENTGSWFWWGKAFCEPETYKSVFKYTVEYLRDEKDVHNILYVYGPGSEAATLAEYEERYPGDAYVDMVGFDAYDSNPVTDEEGYTFQTNFENTVRLTDEFAKLHGKLFAVTETGITSDQGGLPAVGNKRPDWFMEILDIVTKEEYNCCYFMIWTNYSDSSYYTPFVASVKEDGTLHGHEMINEFIEFYNNEKSIFASDQKEILNGPAPSAPQRQGWDEADGYFTAPIAGTRILEETAVQARLNRECGDVVIKAAAGDKEIPLSVSVSGKTAHAVLTDEILKELGETVSGRLILYVEGDRRQEIPVIFNIAEAERDPLCVDDFERYYGSSELLNSSWSVNKDSGCELALTLADDVFYDGEYSLRFEYRETRTGWAGATVPCEADWSSCNALQFWVVPDGKNQKTVVQINTSDGGSYEAYLNTYEAYASSSEPLLVTMPFSEFVDKGGRGALTSAAAANVSNFGLWVNAVPDSDAVDENGQVSGVLYYDSIKAVDSESTVPVFADPGQPENPDNPGQPEDPVRPEDPDDTQDPVQPEDPDDTQTPELPGTSDGTEEPERTDAGTEKTEGERAPQTGDESWDWIIMTASGAMSVLLGTAVGRRRKKNGQR